MSLVIQWQDPVLSARVQFPSKMGGRVASGRAAGEFKILENTIFQCGLSLFDPIVYFFALLDCLTALK